jgi:hypothetical protein
MYEKQPFEKIKPPFLAPQISATPKKLLTYKKEPAFLETLSNKLNDTTEQHALPNTITPQTKTEKYHQANRNATFQTALMQNGTDFFSAAELAKMELVKKNEKTNAQKFNDDKALNYRGLFHDGITTQVADQIRTKKTKKTIDSPNTEDNTDPIDGEEFTYSHNLNLYRNPTDPNIFKKKDPSYQLFKESRYYKVLDENFISPLRHLGKNIFDTLKTNSKKLQKKTPHY